ncbi:hypothetical protein [Sphingobacterium sp.]|uniref:hypothetical protein n=1 Tax=Sphingobacterium sp. TaxID=341027 RepID=UPI0028A05948|nr:hypothetical protein [Sphingobacterium sp.]
MTLIESIQYAPADQIVRWIPTGNSVTVQPLNGWSDLPMHVASGEYTETSKDDKSGRMNTITISARLKEEVTLPETLIIKVNFCNGTNIIVGSPDIPVYVTYNNSLFLNTLTISYNTFYRPIPMLP